MRVNFGLSLLALALTVLPACAAPSLPSLDTDLLRLTPIPFDPSKPYVNLTDAAAFALPPAEKNSLERRQTYPIKCETSGGSPESAHALQASRDVENRGADQCCGSTSRLSCTVTGS